MPSKIIVYGHGDTSEKGFPTTEALIDYLDGGIFRHEDGRYRYTQAKPADVIIVAREGWAFGHLVADEVVDPATADLEAYPRVKKVYLVKKSVRYQNPVHLHKLGVSNYKFGKYIDEGKFAEITEFGGEKYEFGRVDCG